MTTEFYILCCETAKNGGGIYLFAMESGVPKKKKYFPCDRPMYAVKCDKGLCVLLRAPFPNSDESGYFFIDGALSQSEPIVGTRGVVACHLTVDLDSVYVANYISGNVVKNGELVAQRIGNGPHPTRQTSPHLHFVAKTRDGNLLACDLGTDTLALYDTQLQPISEARVPDGYGIRHLALSKDNNTIFAINELVPSVSIFRYATSSLSYVGTLNIPCQNKRADGAASRLSDDGKRLYVSLREENEICVFDVDGEDISLVGRFSSGGNSPRDFHLIDDYLIVTNEKSGNVVGFVLRNDTPSKHFEIQLPAPLCVL